MGDWKEMKVSQIGKVVSGATPSTSKSEYWNGSINWITPNDLSKIKTPFIADSDRKISELGLESCSAQLIPSGNLVMSSRAPIGYFSIVLNDFTTNQGCKSIIFEKAQCPIFHYYNFLFRVNVFKEKGEGTTFAEISKRVIEKLEFTFPESYSEQSTIATILTTIDQTIEKTEQIIAKYERIKTGLMQDLLTCGIDEKGNIRSEETHEFKDSVLGRIPKEWEVAQISQIVKQDKQVTYGIVQPGIYDPFGSLLIRGVDYISGWKPVNSFFKVRNSLHEQYKRSKVTAGDVLICIVGATTGTVQVIPSYIIDANITQTTARISCNEDIANGLFIYYQLHSIIGSHQVRKYIKGSAQPGLNLKDVEKFFVKLPKIEEQNKIYNVLQELDSAIKKELKQLSKMIQTKTGLMQDLLTGKVRVDALINQIQETI